MSIFFDFKTIHELIEDNCYMQPKEFTLEDLSQYNENNRVVNIPTNTQINQDTSKFTPDDWIRYIDPLVTYALRDPTQGMDTKRAYQKFILLGVLVGLGKTPPEAINQVQEWQNTGASQLLKSGTNIGSTGSMGTGATGIGGNTGTSGNTNKINRLYLD